MHLHKGAEHCGNLLRRGTFNVDVDSEAVVKRAHYISEISLNCFYCICGGGGGVRASQVWNIFEHINIFKKSEMFISRYVQCTL
jgi:hypothetical protein